MLISAITCLLQRNSDAFSSLYLPLNGKHAIKACCLFYYCRNWLGNDADQCDDVCLLQRHSDVFSSLYLSLDGEHWLERPLGDLSRGVEN